jgi:hypothetical protein
MNSGHCAESKGPLPSRASRDPPSPEGKEQNKRTCSPLLWRGRDPSRSEGRERSLKVLERKKEGLFLSLLSASMRWFEKYSVFGSEPLHGTQRFVPKFGDDLWFPCFSHGRSSRVRSCRGARFHGAGCSASCALESLVLQGLTLGSRELAVLLHPPAGAAHGSGRIDKLANLIPPFQNHREGIWNIIGTLSREIGK